MRSAPRFSESHDDKDPARSDCDHESDWPPIAAPTHTTASTGSTTTASARPRHSGPTIGGSRLSAWSRNAGGRGCRRRWSWDSRSVAPRPARSPDLRRPPRAGSGRWSAVVAQCSSPGRVRASVVALWYVARAGGMSCSVFAHDRRGRPGRFNPVWGSPRPAGSVPRGRSPASVVLVRATHTTRRTSCLPPTSTGSCSPAT